MNIYYECKYEAFLATAVIYERKLLMTLSSGCIEKMLEVKLFFSAIIFQVLMSLQRFRKPQGTSAVKLFTVVIYSVSLLILSL